MVKPQDGASRPGLPATPAGLPPGARAVAEALEGAQALAGLRQRMAGSQQRLKALLPLLPPALQADVRAGPLDEAGWSLLARHQAAAAKLRQMVPMLQAALEREGLGAPPMRIKILIDHRG